MFHALLPKWLLIACPLFISVALAGCNRSTTTRPVNGDADPTANATATDQIVPKDGEASVVSDIQRPLFEELAPSSSGVDFVQRLDPEHPLAYLYHSGYSCGGVCLGDINGDGLSDIFLASGPDANALFLNRGDLKFERANVFASDQSDSWSVGASMADVDGDGDLDIFVCNYDSPNMLWINEGVDDEGAVRFSEVAKECGVQFIGPSHCPYFSDFDQDGDLDLFLLTNRLYSPTGRPNGVASELGPFGEPRIKKQYAKYLRVVQPSVEAPAQDPNAKTPGPFMLEYGHEDRLYRNDGQDDRGSPQFVDVTSSSGIENIIGHGLSALIWDVNGDGLPDIYVANDYTDPDRFWINRGADQSGRFQFVDRTDEYVPHTAWSAMGSDIADVNGDGKFDFMVADMAATTHFKSKSTMGAMHGWRRWVLENGWPRQAMRNMLYVNSGATRFKEAAFLAGVGNSDWTWSVKFADFDLDGRNDLYLTNGSARVFSDSDIIIKPQMMIGQTEWSIFRNKPEMREKNIAFRNGGGLQFDKVGRQWNLDKEGMSYGAATGDLDNDGDLDLVVCNLNDSVSVYRNHASESGLHWLRVKLEGTGENRFGIGAVVTATLPKGGPLVRLMNPQTGFLSGNDPVLHFGLGTARKVKSLQVRWADGKVAELGEQDANQMLVVTEDAVSSVESSQSPKEFVDSKQTDFNEVSERIGLRFHHKETLFNDYDREFLLPGKLSQFGPGVAVADVNRDGLDDVFVGGAAGQSGVLFVHLKDHTFRLTKEMPWAVDAASEDMGVLFFDADRDGDLDLYVAHGSNERPAGDRLYTDSLYLNQTELNGPVRFTKCDEGALPALRNSGACVVGADFDRDGDVDLFVGSRSIPGQYPRTPDSILLRNDGEKPGEVKFTDVTDAVASDLRKCGLVTGAVWSDVDSNGWCDLLVTSEWGPVHLFTNRQGTLEDVTREVAFVEHPGWWNSIVAGDFDSDGDTDYATMNVGLNTKYGRATTKKPAILYRGDMDGNGGFDLVEAKASSEHGELPVRGRSCSCNAMPGLKAKFPTYKQFALSSLEGIYTNTGLQNAERYAATEFRSGVWINESSAGDPKFSWQPLAVDAQLSPGFGAVVADFYGQSKPALAILQNHFTREPETGLWRGGLGTIATPSQGTAFEHVETGRSGFQVDGDGKGMAIADLDGDNRPDLIAAQNDDVVKAFLLNTKPTTRPVAVRLEGLPGNPLAFGGRVSLVSNGKTLASAEVQGGSGYLSQSSSTVFFSRPQSSTDLTVRVVWPSGKESTTSVDATRRIVRIKE